MNAIVARVDPDYFEGSDIVPPPLPSIPEASTAELEPETDPEPLAALPDGN